MVGFKDAENVDHAHQELLDAGLTQDELTRHYAAEVHLGECTVNLKRRKRCWSVRLSKGLPFEVAKQLNRDWGEKIRVRGAAARTPLQEGEAVLLWEIDDADALQVLIRTVKDHFLASAATG